MVSILLIGLMPFVMSSLVWISGRLILTSFGGSVRLEGLAVLVGLPVLLFLTANCSFLGLATTPIVMWLGIVLIAGVALARRRVVFANVNRREFVSLVIIQAIGTTHFLLPVLLSGEPVFLLDAGDFHSYISMGSWLAANPIGIPYDFGQGFNSVQLDVAQHQQEHLRLGALFLLAGYGSLAFSSVSLLYTSFGAWLVPLQAIAVLALVRTLFPGISVWWGTALAVLYAVSTTLVWAGYASFIPQTLGLTILVTWFCFFIPWIIEVPSRLGEILVGPRSIVPLGLTAFALWSVYPEGAPLLVALTGMFTIFSLRSHLLSIGFLAQLALSTAAILGIAICASPHGFWWGAQGLIAQFQGNPHGGAQLATPWNLFLTMIGSSLQPINKSTLSHGNFLLFVASLAAAFSAVAGAVYAITRGRVSFVAAMLVTASLLFAYISRRYSLEAFAEYRWRVDLLTWNYFKAAQYLTPFAFAVAIGGAFALAASPSSGRWWSPLRLIPALAFAFGMLVVTAYQTMRLGEGISVGVEPGASTVLATLPAGRVLLDLGEDGEEMSPPERYLYYGLLAGRPFISRQDWQSDAVAREGSDALLSSYLSEPISFVVTREPSSIEGGALMGSFGPYSVLDVRQTTLVVSLPYQRRHLTFLSVPSRDEHGPASVKVFDVNFSKLIIDADDQHDVVEAANRLFIPVDVSAMTGGLVRLGSQPALRQGVKVVLGDDGPWDLVYVDDLLARIGPEVISPLPSGTKMTMTRISGMTVFALAEPGYSRAEISFSAAAPGDYFIRMEFGKVEVKREREGGYTAFFGVENRADSMMELGQASDTAVYYRVSLREPGVFRGVIGMGAYGAATGSFEVKSIDLYRRQ
jgi:hypothetical protein